MSLKAISARSLMLVVSLFYHRFTIVRVKDAGCLEKFLTLQQQFKVSRKYDKQGGWDEA
jgi:hypothetical protein